MDPKSISAICEFFKKQSHWAWNRIEFARKMSLSIRETTITEELLFRFWSAYYEEKISVRIYESKAEHKNGNDLEIFVKTSKGYVLLVCQAKIADSRGVYRHFFHKVRGKLQIRLLADYAQKLGGIPQYLLYNYVPTVLCPEELLEMNSHEDYGITSFPAGPFLFIIDTLKLIEKGYPIPSFNMLHPNLAIPIHHLICALLKDLFLIPEAMEEAQLTRIKFYTEAEIDSEDWRWIQEPAAIGFVTPKEIVKEIATDAKNDNKVFRPKFRVIIGGEFNRGQLVSIS